MPVDVAFDDLAGDTGTVAIGVGGDEVEPVVVDFDGGGPNLLVLGESGSGRTTALQTIATSSLRADPTRAVWVIADRGAWPSEIAGRAQSEAEAEALLGRLRSASAASHLLIVDDAERLPRSVADAVGALARNMDRLDLRVIVAGRAHDVIRSYDDWLRYLVSLRHAVLLSPPPDIESTFDLRPARIRPPSLPGRGLLVSRQGVVPLQVARVGLSAVLQRDSARSHQPG
jgi:S-DNA-T family DNA segregation ATPase FtsK/SpoIIIE